MLYVVQYLRVSTKKVLYVFEDKCLVHMNLREVYLYRVMIILLDLLKTSLPCLLIKKPIDTL